MSVELKPVVKADLGQPLGQCRVAPLRTGSGAGHNGIDALLAVYAADFDVDPFIEMFFFPTDTLKVARIDLPTGEVRWTRDLGRGTVPGMWFAPVLPFDLDGDGVDEVYLVDNPEASHPLGPSHYRLMQLDVATGEAVATRPWPKPEYNQSLSHTFRFFLMGGHSDGEPVLVSAQGTYGPMKFQGWSSQLDVKWETGVGRDRVGALGSHKCPVLDIDADGDDEWLWGERCFSMRDGQERWCADSDTWRGHSDLTEPVFDRKAKSWSVFTARESEVDQSPRVVLYDGAGSRKWAAVDRGHMDMGWCARLGDRGEHVGVAIRINHKTCGPDGRFHVDPEAFAFELASGKPVELPFDPYGTLPIDLTGEGRHAMVYGVSGHDGRVIDREGRTLGRVDGTVAAASKLLDLPGEQLVVFDASGQLSVWANQNAVDTREALERYANPAYRSQQRHTATGSNLTNLGGI